MSSFVAHEQQVNEKSYNKIKRTDGCDLYELDGQVSWKYLVYDHGFIFQDTNSN